MPLTDSSSSPVPSLSSQRRLLPTGPGVYIFKNSDGKVIYIGKAKNLNRRVASYFLPPVKLGPKTALLVSRISSLDFIPVTSEIEALLLESRLIKKFKPHFNLISKDDKSPYFIHITKEIYPRPIINHELKGSLAGPFLNRRIPTQLLRHFRRIAPYCTADRPVKSPCFYSHLGLCRPCPGHTATAVKDYQTNLLHLRRLLKGQFKSVASELEKGMVLAVRRQDFETAATHRDQIRALAHLKLTPILPDEYLENPNLAYDLRQTAISALSAVLSKAGLNLPELHRIEMYDNAHLSGQAATAAMVVSINGELVHRLYRHFHIRHAASGNDPDMMLEILSRRLARSDWPAPDLIVLDGGIPQLSSLSSLPAPHPPIIALAKRLETIMVPGPDGEYRHINLPQEHPGLRLLQSLRDEAHRFSRRLHHRLRSKSLISG